MAKILIVEDESLIALMLEDWVVELGHVVVGPVSSVEKALSIIETDLIDVAVIDYHLHGHTADDIVVALEGRNIPFAIASGDSSGHTNSRFSDKLKLDKPYTFEMVSGTLAILVEAKNNL
jgi:CheY-like chemotaxis protein